MPVPKLCKDKYLALNLKNWKQSSTNIVDICSMCTLSIGELTLTQQFTLPTNQIKDGTNLLTTLYFCPLNTLNMATNHIKDGTSLLSTLCSHYPSVITKVMHGSESTVAETVELT
jgi:hypothetical protein